MVIDKFAKSTHFLLINLPSRFVGDKSSEGLFQMTLYSQNVLTEKKLSLSGSRLVCFHPFAMHLTIPLFNYDNNRIKFHVLISQKRKDYDLWRSSGLMLSYERWRVARDTLKMVDIDISRFLNYVIKSMVLYFSPCTGERKHQQL